ncbi:MAG: hypothetical protein ACPL6C_02290 [bacterium]
MKGFLPLLSELPERPEYIRPGELIRIENGKIRKYEYYSLKVDERVITMEQIINTLGSLLDEAVRFNLTPTCGALLSGGLDSSCIV